MKTSLAYVLMAKNIYLNNGRIMKIKTSSLIARALDLAVAQCIGYNVGQAIPKYSINWAKGGPIIERENICIDLMLNNDWLAVCRKITDGPLLSGPTPLIAAMRCFVASKLGDEIEFPNELI